MTRIQNLPDDSTFGYEFNYALWTPGTQIVLANVPWDNDYRDVVRFANDLELNNYLTDSNNTHITVENMTYAKTGEPIRINVPFNRAYSYNYLRAHNDAQPVPGEDFARYFYYFILDVRYVAPNTTEIVVQLDVWQTFSRRVQFGRCYIERGHIGIADGNAFHDDGRARLTMPEGFDLGNEYQILNRWAYSLGRAKNFGDNEGVYDYDIIVASTTKLHGDLGTVDDPKMQTAEGSNLEFLPNGCNLYWFKSASEFIKFSDTISDKPWASQGIVSITAVPNLANANLNYTDVSGDGYSMLRINSGSINETQVTLREGFRDAMQSYIPDRYRNLKKFLTYPYSSIELTTYTGTPLVLKPEAIKGTDLTANVFMHLAPPSPRIVVTLSAYNAVLKSVIDSHDGEFMDMTTGIFDLPTFSVVNNGYLSYMASNRNSIAYAHSSADWAQQKALQGAQTAYDNATTGMNLASDMNAIGNAQSWNQYAISSNAMRERTQVGVGTSAVGGVGAALSGNVGGAVSSATGIVANTMNYNINNTAAHDSTVLGMTSNTSRVNRANAATGMIRDANYNLAQYAAKGDYANAIAAINAKVQDAKLIQPTTSGQVGGDAFMLATWGWRINAIPKLLSPGALEAIGEFWLRYGYAVNRFGDLGSIGLLPMSKFCYWKLKETYIRSSTVPESYRMAIRGIMEKGVTVWDRPEQIGNTDPATNDPKDGVYL